MDSIKINPTISIGCENCDHSTLTKDWLGYKTITCHHPEERILSDECHHFKPKRRRRIDITLTPHS